MRKRPIYGGTCKYPECVLVCRTTIHFKHSNLSALPVFLRLTTRGHSHLNCFAHNCLCLWSLLDACHGEVLPLFMFCSTDLSLCFCCLPRNYWFIFLPCCFVSSCLLGFWIFILLLAYESILPQIALGLLWLFGLIHFCFYLKKFE